MILNLIHRYQPGYDECFDFQQRLAHSLGLKVTVFISSSLLCEERRGLAERFIADSERFGDELALWPEPYDAKRGQFIWLLSEEDKHKSLETAIGNFEKYIGYAPRVIGSYVTDSSMMRMIKSLCPTVTTVIAGCFEEGVRVFHGCNNSWYLFSEGMSWNPWYPSKTHALRPAKNENDWAGIVALPHLSRDLALAYESRNDFFASHPPNIQRGLVNDGASHNYDFNLVDQYRMQEDFNNGFSYYQIHVSPSWLSGCACVMDSDEITQKMYREQLEYMRGLKQSGSLHDMTVSEFGEYYRRTVPIGTADAAVAKEMLFGSKKHYFWLASPSFRVLVDCDQGGSIGDLRPYNAEFEAFTGVDSPMREIHTYPYIIQSQLRTGVKTHCRDGSRTTLIVTVRGVKKDLCYCQSRVDKVERNGGDVILTLSPVSLDFDGDTVKIRTVYTFCGEGKLRIKREILEKPKNERVELCEYFNGCFGFTEYPEDMNGIRLYADEEELLYGYIGRRIVKEDASRVGAVIPQINARVELRGSGRGYACEGHLFAPFYTLALAYEIEDEGSGEVCLTITRE